jgi:hypothetical protein
MATSVSGAAPRGLGEGGGGAGKATTVATSPRGLVVGGGGGMSILTPEALPWMTPER